MLFNSAEFIFLFLPITLILFYVIGGQGHHRVAISWLVGASLFFYAWWNPAYLGLMLGSILFNYSIGVAISSRDQTAVTKKALLIFGITANLGLLGYYKYTGFFLANINSLVGTGWEAPTILLPLAISFFTFQQIAYLVDSYRRETHEYNFLHYCLFVTFFPQLIAGPIVHHKEMMPQFTKKDIYGFRIDGFSIGLTIFVIGLFKKVVLADSVAGPANSVFSAAEQGVDIAFLEAWAGSLAYTVQLYFDFSGYSDMAIGIARMFGILLPLNFNSPYKAENIIDFWRRWHITLSRFLRDYLYIPLGGSRKGSIRRYMNLLTTMLIGGLWHGAGWTFVVWGGLHGIYLVINNAWRWFADKLGFHASNSWFWKGISRLITFLSVVVAWVFFRAESFEGAVVILKGMIGYEGLVLPLSFASHWLTPPDFVSFAGNGLGTFGSTWYFLFVLVLVLITWIAPSTQQIMINYRPALEVYGGQIIKWYKEYFQWRPNSGFAVYAAILSVASLAVIYMGRKSEFLYFQF